MKTKTKNKKQTIETQVDSSLRGWLVDNSLKRMTTEEVFDYVRNEHEKAAGGLNAVEIEVGIGTDSQVNGRNFRFVTVLCLYKKGKGGFYFYRPESLPREKYDIKNQKLRMFDEVSKSIELSLKLKEETGIDPVIHIDASPSKKDEFTSSFSDQLKGYAQACGFEALIKPDSYVASGIADSHSKSKSQRKERRRHKANNLQ